MHQKCGGHTWSTRYFWFHVAKSGQGGPSPYQISGLTVLELWINLSDLNDGENLNEFWTNQSAKHLQWVGGKAEASIGCLPPSECQYVNTPSVYLWPFPTGIHSIMHGSAIKHPSHQEELLTSIIDVTLYFYSSGTI